MSNKKSNQIRELPKSLQGIETILTYLNERSKEALSIRNISENTEISMRVTKNILLQLEKFNQIERVVEENNILPKWRITKFGKKVLKEAQGKQENITFTSREDELLNNIIIPLNIETLFEEIRENKDNILSKLKSIQMDLSKILGTVLNLNNPIFEDLISIIINQIKFFNQKITNFPSNPLAVYQLKKKDEKQKKISKEEIKNLMVELFFIDSIIFNELNRIDDYILKISRLLEIDETIKSYSTTKDLREDIRFLYSLINKRESVKINSHVLSIEHLNSVSKNKINSDILNDLIDIQFSKEEQIELTKDHVLNFIAKLTKREKEVKNIEVDLTKNIPLYAFYELILDEEPNLDISIEQLEEIINALAEEGYLPGIKIIQGDEEHYLKLIQFEVQDISKNELELVSKALKLQSFTLADIVGTTGWDIKQVQEILNHLTEIGILKYSKNYLHGDRWYIVSENKF